MKVVQVYAPTSSHEDQIVESFYEDVESAMGKVKAQYTVLMGDFSAKIGKKQAGDHAVGDYGIGTRNNRGELLVEFAERNNPRIINTFFRKRENRRWTWKRPNGDTTNEIDFILCAHPGIVHDVEVIAKVRCSDHRMERSRIVLDIQRERRKQVRKKPIDEFAMRGKVEEFQILLQSRYSAITEDEALEVQAINDNLNNIIRECAVEVGGRTTRQNTSKLSNETKGLIKKRQNMKASNNIDKIELAKLSKLINKREVNDIRKHNMQSIEQSKSSQEETRHKQK